MKRTAILFLVLVLLLAACSKTPAPEPSEAPVSTAVPIPVPTQPTTEAVTVSTPEPTTEPVTKAPEPPAPETEPSAPETTEPEPAPTAWTVYTDWSAYRPDSGVKATYTRLHPGALDHFEPSEDYGMVFPYEAAVQTIDWDAWYKEERFTYGLADRNGRILTDGIFYDVQLVSVDDPAPRSCWLVSRVISEDLYNERYPFVEYDFWDAGLPEVYGLISLDGSTALDCVYPEFRRIENGFLFGSGQGQFDYTLYNSDLEPVLRLEKIFGDAECDEWNLQYGDGLYLARTAVRAETWDFGNYEYLQEAYWFCDENGNQVLGPYADASTFHEGLACVSPDGERYGYIDKTGAWAIQPLYSWNEERESDFQDGRAIQCTENGAYVVLDRSGRELIRQENNGQGCYIFREDCGFQVKYFTDVYGQHFEYRDYYDPDGKLLASGNGKLECLDENTFTEYDTATGTVRVFTRERTVLTFDASQVCWDGWLFKGAYLRDGYLLMGWFSGAINVDRTRAFFTLDFSQMEKVEPVYRSPLSYGGTYGGSQRLVEDRLTGEEWYFWWGGTSWEGRTEGGKRCTVPLWAVELAPMGDLVYARTLNASCLLTLDGEIVFCYPIDQGD